MLDAIERGESPIILGDGSEAFDFVAVEDCAQANVCAMKANQTDSFYNVGTGIRTSLKELAELLLELKSCPLPVNYAPRSQATLVRNRIGCAQKAHNEIGYIAAIELRDGLKRLIDWRDAHKSQVDARRSAQRMS
jgi:UDP-glucose 4-epimerase